MSVTAAAGFDAAGVAAGIKRTGALDLALVVNRGPLTHAAAVFTSNRSQANPILWSKQIIADGRVDAIVLNSGGANCFTGSEGFQVTHRTAEAAATALGISAGDVLVCSTGLIGEQLNPEVLEEGVLSAVDRLAATVDAGLSAARAIMTTDSAPKTVIVEGGGAHESGGERKGKGERDEGKRVSRDAGAAATSSTFTRDQTTGWRIGGMAKGAGMLAPGLATMLVVLTTDAVVSASDLDAALRAATRVSFDRLDSDGCMSTNDQVTLLASGASGIAPAAADFTAALTSACRDLAQQLQTDAEGASHDITIEVRGAATEDDAVEVGRAVARNNLFKAAIFGNDPNWGRVLAAIGTTRAPFDPYLVDVSMNGVRLCHAGAPDAPREAVDLTPRATHLLIELHAGEASAMIWTNDLTHDYVHENSAYAS